MLWNLVTINYEKYKLHHCAYFILLVSYSLFGGFLFQWIEGQHEDGNLHATNVLNFRNSVAAKKRLIATIEDLYLRNGSSLDFQETKLRSALSKYDVQMGFQPQILKEKKWTMWGSLYYAGTIYTTIGYGDLAASTLSGRIATMLYAMIGIPMVITILNDWGTLLFNLVQWLWTNHASRVYRRLSRAVYRCCCSTARSKSSDQSLLDEQSDDMEKRLSIFDSLDDSGEDAIPLFMVVVVLSFWVSLCCGIFCWWENWTFFEAMYFFFISMTTIGFGDITPSHKVAVINFLFILMGLSVVSMAINIIQMNLEQMFTKIVSKIERDFKNSLEDGGRSNNYRMRLSSLPVGDALKTNAAKSEAKGMKPGDVNVVKEYTKDFDGTQKLLMRFMSNHQKKMLEEKFDERAKMRNKYTQTYKTLITKSVQTHDKEYYDPEDYPDEKQPTCNPAISTKRLYIYNIGSD